MAMPTSGGTCTYNGVSFTAGYKSRVSAMPMRDEANRTTTDVKHTIEVDGYIAATTTDTTLASMRKALTAQGGALTFTGKGYGDLTVNGSSSVRDVAWGPIPELLEWIPIGSENAAKVKWRCTTRIPECDNAAYQNQLMAFNYEISTDIDVDGRTEVTYSGYLEIPMTRTAQGDRTPPDTADKYLERIAPPLQTGFNRRWHRLLSKDKRRLDFTITDRQLLAAYPDGITDMDIDQSVDSDMKRAFCNWSINIEGTVTTAVGVDKSKALAAFLQVVQSRVRKGASRSTKIYPTRFRVSEKVMGITTSFAMSLIGINLQGMFEVFSATNMWKKIDGTDFGRWGNSLANYANNPRGQANLMHSPSNDAIIDLCSSGSSTLTAGQSRTIRASGVPGRITGVTCPPPDPQDSWLRGELRIRYKEKAMISTYKPLPLEPISNSSTLRTFSPSNRAGKDVIGPGIEPAPGMQSAPKDEVQRPLAPSRSLLLEGFGIRLGKRVPVPSLVHYQGLELTEVDRDIAERTLGEIGGIPIFATIYRLEYHMAGYPQSGIPTVPVPTMQSNGLSGMNAGQTSTLNARL